jgi:hypothetical protein
LRSANFIHLTSNQNRKKSNLLYKSNLGAVVGYGGSLQDS